MADAVSSKRPNPLLLAAILLGHVGITTLTWRDLRNRPADQVRGPKPLWRALSAANTLGSLAYVLFGRRRG